MPQPHQRCVGNPFGLHTQLFGALLQEVAREHRNVFEPLAQRGQAQADHVQAVEQVLPEAALFNALLQVLVGGCDHTHVGLDGVVPTHTVEVAVAQHPQQTGLQVERHIADFVEEQCAALGLLETPPAHGLRASESAAFMAEQFTLQQVFGDCCSIDSNKWPIGARRVLVECTGYQLFAGAGLTGDHHRDVALAQTPDGAEHVLHGGRLAQHFGGVGHTFFGHFLALAFLHGTADQLHRLGQVKRFGQVLKRPALEGRHGAVQVGKRRHDDDGQTGVFGFDLLEQVEAGAPRHTDVADQHLRALAVVVAAFVQRRQNFTRVGKAAGGQVLPQERLFQHKADGLVVVYYPDRLHEIVWPQVRFFG